MKMLSLKNIALTSFYLALVYFQSSHTEGRFYRRADFVLSNLRPSTICTTGHATFVERLNFTVYLNFTGADPLNRWEDFNVDLYLYNVYPNRLHILTTNTARFCTLHPDCIGNWRSKFMKFNASVTTDREWVSSNATIIGQWYLRRGHNAAVSEFSNSLYVGALSGYNRHKALAKYGNNEITYPLEFGKRCVILGRAHGSNLSRLRFCAYDGPGGSGFDPMHLTDCNGNTAMEYFHTGNPKCVKLDYTWTGRACNVTFTYRSRSTCRDGVEFTCRIQAA
ncbi:uncharacterized protein LOC131938532 [Physella acuta]|uniref:uncharacterized protein LOC131938532 n=1 Tax=Physella acuta TaxID=109671 RepID=UPI0027DB0AD0|nr:uncharacterized protein LOC131938532 [Physella acuta]XP_059152574.1 uncharacterized protein LOC131938532 [Physella acuta]XP_059152575.1 uncharacterized protein LOC131938532 [Physella acuta]